MTSKMAFVRIKNRLFIPLMIVIVYAGITTPLAYEAGRRHVVNWALNQPEADALVAAGYTKQDRDALEDSLDHLPLGKPKTKSKDITQ